MSVVLKNSKLSNCYKSLSDVYLNKINPEIHKKAYIGAHEGLYAEIEFAGKYLDTCIRFYKATNNEEFLKRAESVVRSIVRNQHEDGYLGGLVSENDWKDFSVWNQTFTVYGLVSYCKVTGDEKAADAAEKCINRIAEHYMSEKDDICEGLNDGSQNLTILVAATALYDIRPTDKIKSFIIYIAEKIKKSDNNFFSFDSVLDLRSKKGIENFVILLGIIAYGDITGDNSAYDACRKYWNELNEKQIRETGNGSIHERWNADGNKPMFIDYEREPNENCVAVGWFELSRALFNRFKETRYVDAMEKNVYNHLLGSMNLECSDFGYYQPNYGIKYLDSNTHAMYMCCRYRGYSAISQIPYSIFDEDDKYITPIMYTDCEYTSDISIKETTKYPYDGRICFDINGNTEKKLRLRIPNWCKNFSVERNGEVINELPSDGYVCVDISDGDKITLDLKPEFEINRVKINGKKYAYITYGCVLLAIDSNLNECIYDIEISDSSIKRENFDDYLIGCSIDGYLNDKKIRVNFVDYASSAKVNIGDEFTIYVNEK